LYESLIQSYLDDVEKYADSSAQVPYIRHIINTAFSEAGHRITFEKFGNSDYKSREMKEAFSTLEKTMLVNLIYPHTNTSIPILPNLRKKPRLHLIDTGLVNFKAGLQLELLKKQNIEGVYQGSISGHIIGQELLAYEKSILKNLSFWVRDKKSSSAEIDYLKVFESLLIPIEVKSGQTGRLKSLHLFMEEAKTGIAVRVHSGKYSVESVVTKSEKTFKLINVPFYLVNQLERIVSKEI
jgi:uncharacterized protein